MKLTFLDRIIGHISPERGLARFAARARMELATDLASFAAAEKNRRNADWNAKSGSADAHVIPDMPTLNARARQLERDSWIIQSSVRAAKRNIVGCGILPVPVGKDANDQPLEALNTAAEDLFWRWASDRKACDVEKRRTFWRTQRLCVGEKKLVGEHFVVWSYKPNLLPDGRLDPHGQVGLRLQSFEPEQLDTTAWSYTLPDGSVNEVRNGIEVDEDGAAVAYHFWTRSPNDIVSRRNFRSRRITADRVLHYFDSGRVQQSHGVTEYHAVLQRVRDYHRRDDAEMWAAIMEACIGMVITRPIPTGGFGNGSAPSWMTRQSGDTGATASGMRTIDFTPGMVPELQPGEEIKPFTPQRPGGTYEPYAIMNLTGIAAGAGQSYGQLTRDFKRGTYSGQRQELLTDRQEDEPEQDDLIDSVVRPVWELFYGFAVLENKLPLSLQEYAADRQRYHDAEHVTPSLPWIDPEKESNAWEKALALRVITRKEIAASQGRRLTRMFKQLGAEKKLAAENDLTLPEDQTQDPSIGTGPEVDPLKAKLDTYGVAVRAGAITPQTDDEKSFRTEMKLPAMSAEAVAAWKKDEGTRRPITITEPGVAKTTPPAATPKTALPADDDAD